MYGNKWIVEDQRDMPQKHIRIKSVGMEGMSEEKVIFNNDNG